MTTIRVAQRRRFATIDRATVNDCRLSFRARGVLSWLLDKPDDWKIDAEALANHGTEGRDAIRKALKELEEFGYLVRRKWHGDDGRWCHEQVLYERPQPATDSEGSTTEIHTLKNRRRSTSGGEPAADSQALLQEDCEQKTDTEQPCPPAASERKPRERDPLWEAVLGACGIRLDAELTKTERGRYNAAVKELRDVAASPAEVSRRARTYRATWPKASLTPNALSANWSLLAADIQQRPKTPKAWDSIKRHFESRKAQEASA